MKFQYFIIAFVVIRFLLSLKKKNEENNNTEEPIIQSKSSSIIEGIENFMNKLNFDEDKDFHKAEDDSHKAINWQEVEKTHIKEKERLIKHSDYQNISYRNENIKEIETVIEEPEEEYFEVDLEQAIIYKEILERKYFSV